MNKLLVLMSILACFLMYGCATPNFSPRFERFGEYTDSEQLEGKADKMKWREAKKIKVFMGDLPKSFKMEGPKLVTTNPDYEILGKVSADIKKSGFGFYDYPEPEDWKDIYCGVQTPLVWVTLALWRLIPLNYPCGFAENDSVKDVNRRKNYIINTMKKMTKAAGGNALIVTEIGETQLVNKNTNEKVGGLKMTSASGYAIKIKKKKRKK